MKKYHKIVQAEKAEAATHVKTARGIVVAYPGDYIITDEAGNRDVAKPKAFETEYKELAASK